MDSAVQTFAAVDTDADGALSRAEVEGTLPGIAGAFAELDLDGDGKLTSLP
jgi:Ca2+-binding EF-hand superfamily protein